MSLTVAFQSDVVHARRVVQRERDIVRLRQVQHSLQEQISRVVEHGRHNRTILRWDFRRYRAVENKTKARTLSRHESVKTRYDFRFPRVTIMCRCFIILYYTARTESCMVRAKPTTLFVAFTRTICRFAPATRTYDRRNPRAGHTGPTGAVKTDGDAIRALTDCRLSTYYVILL